MAKKIPAFMVSDSYQLGNLKPTKINQLLNKVGFYCTPNINGFYFVKPIGLQNVIEVYNIHLELVQTLNEVTNVVTLISEFLYSTNNIFSSAKKGAYSVYYYNDNLLNLVVCGVDAKGSDDFFLKF